MCDIYFYLFFLFFLVQCAEINATSLTSPSLSMEEIYGGLPVSKLLDQGNLQPLLDQSWLPYFPHYRVHWIIRRTANEWSIFELFSYIKRTDYNEH